MGSGMAKLILEKDGLQLVGAIDTRPEYAGKDVGSVLGLGRELGVEVQATPDGLLDPDVADIVVIATTSWTAQQMPQLRQILGSGLNCISIAEEMASPEAQSPELATELDQLAKANNVSVLGTGVNPGFVLDLLVVTLSGVCHKVDRIEASRVNDLSPMGQQLWRPKESESPLRLLKKASPTAPSSATSASRKHQDDLGRPWPRC